MSQSYFQSYKEYFWEWEDAAEVASERGGQTIAYREFLFQTIDKLAPQGLPPFGSLLLAIAATNPNGYASTEYIGKLVTSKLKSIDDGTLTSALVFMKLLSSIPAPYKVKEKRILLLQAIFEDCHNRLSQKESDGISAACKKEDFSLNKAAIAEDYIAGIFRYDFRPIAILNNKFKTVEDVLKKISALPDLGPIELESDDIPSKHKAGDFVDELIETDTTFHVGSLIRWLWGGLNIPVHSVLPSQQPLGGISDLTNKGNFDKLLISEFAYDDITFLSRLANNEALYLHREVPPAHNDLNRIILIDATIKNWGNPKTIAFALMLAISRHPKTDIVCHSYVLGSKNYYAIATERIHDLIDALQIVEASLHPAESLNLFFADHGKDRNKEIIFITEASSVKHRDLMKVMGDHHEALNYVVYTDVEGNVEVYKKHQRARKLVQHIKLPLTQLWQKKKKLREHQTLEQPIVKSVIPLLLNAGRAKCLGSAPDGAIFQIDETLSILKLYGPERTKGWELLHEHLPFSTKHFEIGISDAGEYVALLFNPQDRQILLINLSTGEIKQTELRKWKTTAWPSFVFDSGKFYHLNAYGGWSISLDGKVNGPANFLQHNKFIERGNQLQEVEKDYKAWHSVFKNIQRVFINLNNEIVLNSHALRLGHHLMIVPSSGGNALHEAKKIGANEFQFAEGSTIKINRSGFIVLTSSNQSMSPIYIPTTLDGALGVATDRIFAGNYYYFKEPLVKLNLANAGSNKLHVTKIVVTELKIALSNAKELVDNAPSILPGQFMLSKAEGLKTEFARHGARVEIINMQTSKQKEIEIGDFYRNYILPFITTVKNHGA